MKLAISVDVSPHGVAVAAAAATYTVIPHEAIAEMRDLLSLQSCTIATV